MPFGFGSSSRRRSHSTYVAPPVQIPSQSQGYAQSAASYAAGGGASRRSASMTSLSGQAAAAALRKHQSSSSLNLAQPTRTGSLSSRSFRPQQSYQQRQPARANSLTSATNRLPQSYSTYQQEQQLASTHSINSNTPRLNQGSEIASTTVTTRHGKDPNTVIRTTRQLGADGRTRSLTKETITKMGSFEVVKTTTIKPPTTGASDFIKPPSAPSAFYAGSILSAGDSELENIAEEFDVDFYIQEDGIGVLPEEEEEIELEEANSNPRQSIAPDKGPRGHAYRQLTQSNMRRFDERAPPEQVSTRNKVSPKLSSPAQFSNNESRRKPEIGDDESNSGDSLYSDAYDLLPSAAYNGNTKRSIIKNADADSPRSSSLASAQKPALHRPRRDSNTSSTRKSVRIDAPIQTKQASKLSPTLVQDGFGRPLREQQKPELTPEQLYAKALEVARQKVYGDRIIEPEDDGYNSDSSFKRSYAREPNQEHRMSLRDSDYRQFVNGQSAVVGRTMSLTSANNGRTMSLNSANAYDSQQSSGLGFRNHSLRAQSNPIAGQTNEKKHRMSSLINRSPSVTNVTGKVDKALDKKQRKETLKALKQERKDAMNLASQTVQAQQEHSEEQHEAPVKPTTYVEPFQTDPPVRNSPQKSTSSGHSRSGRSSRFSIFGKKSKKDQEPLESNVSKPNIVYVSEPFTRQSDFDNTHERISDAERNRVQETLANTNIHAEAVNETQFQENDFSAVNADSLRNAEYTSQPVVEETRTAHPVTLDPTEAPANVPFSHSSSTQNTPTLSLSNHAIDENSSEPRTFEQDFVAPAPKSMRYENYETISHQINSKQPVNNASEDHAFNTEIEPLQNKAQKQRKKKKSFGKKVLGWFDLDD